MILNYLGKPSGQARVQLESEDDLRNAIKCNMKVMGNRYIVVREVFNNEYIRKQKSNKET